MGTYGQEEINDHLHICVHLDLSYKDKVYTLNMYDLKHEFELFLKNQLVLYLSKEEPINHVGYMPNFYKDKISFNLFIEFERMTSLIEYISKTHNELYC